MANVDGGLHFVTSEDPHLNASLSDAFDRLTDLLLQLVLDSCRAKQFKFALD